jgi:hypothetical protein
MAARVKELFDKNETVTHVAIAPSGAWVLIRGDYGFWFDGVTNAMATPRDPVSNSVWVEPIDEKVISSALFQ